jgi:hypothetical protein
MDRSLFKGTITRKLTEVLSRYLVLIERFSFNQATSLIRTINNDSETFNRKKLEVFSFFKVHKL